MPPPLLGFNNNVRHKGKIFHIQTEDSGVKHPRIVTHLFADGGRIVKTTRTDYAEHVGRDDMAELVRAMMKEQHKAMFISLRAGDLDLLLDSSDVRARSASSAGVPVPKASAAPLSLPQRPLSNPNLRKVSPSVPPPGPDGIDLDVGSLKEYREVAGAQRSVVAAKSDERVSDQPRPAGAPASEEGQHAGRYAASRPAAIFGEAPSRDNLFGDSVISEQSLDEVILSYLAEDLEGSQE
jgi:hypothetical protein